MANATQLGFGQVNSAGATDALFLKVFGGEVLAAFEEVNVTVPRHMVKSIASGKSAAFPVTWKVAAAYHVAGAEIVGQTSNANERVVVIDDVLLASVFIASIDEAKSHYDVRGIYSEECGRSLANVWDKSVLQVGVLGARAAANVTGGNAGSSFTSATTLYKTSASDLAAGIFLAAQTLDEKDISAYDRAVFVKPAQYYLLAQSTAVINKDWDGKGSYSEGKVLKVAGMDIVSSNHLPTTLIATGVAKYQGDFTKTAALIMNKTAVATVKLMDLATEMAYDIRRQGTLVIAKYAIGSDYLRPEACVELKTTT